MYDYKSFYTEAVSAWADIKALQPSWLHIDLDNSKQQKRQIESAWLMYEHARDSQLQELVLGDVKLRSHEELLRNFGTTSAKKSAMAARTVPIKEEQVLRSVEKVDPTRDAREAHVRRGSVLNDAHWWPFINDAWVLGGCHGLRIFHLATPGFPDNALLWETTKSRPRVLGRELIGLYAAGYTRISYVSKNGDDRGLVFGPLDATAAQGLTFQRYFTAVAGFDSLTMLRDRVLIPSRPHALYAHPAGKARLEQALRDEYDIDNDVVLSVVANVLLE